MNFSLKSLKFMVRDAISVAIYYCKITQLLHKNKLTVVTFHRVLNASEYQEYPLKNIAVTCEEFEKIICFFSRNFTCGTITDSINRFRSGERPDKPFMAITFDDGQLDNYTNAFPILNKYDVKATFYVTVCGIEDGETLWHDKIAYSVSNSSDHNLKAHRDLLAEFGLCIKTTSDDLVQDTIAVAKTLSDSKKQEFEQKIYKLAKKNTGPLWDGMMDINNIRTIKEYGHEIGSHTISHSILTNCSLEKVRKEVNASKSYLEKKLETEIDSFCYPNGDYNDSVIKQVRFAEYKNAVTTNWGNNKKSQSLLELKRCDIYSQTSRSWRGKISIPRVAMRISGIQPGL